MDFELLEKSMTRRMTSYGFKLVDTVHVLTSLTKATKTMLFKFTGVTLPKDFILSSKQIIASESTKDKSYFDLRNKLTKSDAIFVFMN